MKTRKTAKKQETPSEPREEALELREVPPPYYSTVEVQSVPAPESMVRTQIYLTRKEHEFLQVEAERRGEPMSAFLRRVIDERMQLPETAWKRNPMLDETPDVEGWAGREDGALNHDHYIYGGEKKYVRGAEGWQLQPPIKE
jgi:hypothetical protein